MSLATPHQTPFHERHDDELLTLSEVAEILSASENTVRWWRQIGSGPSFFKIGRRLYTTVGELRRFIREQRIASRPVIPTTRRN
ncbi:MAG: helix-turn-helix domain-containing protein [Nocardioides sp.]